MKILARVYFLLISLVLMTTIAAADEGSISVTHPDRAFGYVIGDRLEQKINLQQGGETLTIKQLPETQREGRWITRQGVIPDPDGQQLTIRYQIINSPPDVRLVSLPGLILDTDQGSRIDIPEWFFSIAPLTPAVPGDDTALPVMQADWKPLAPTPTRPWRNIKVLSAALILTLLSWLIWWLLREMNEARALPFAHAYRLIRRNKPQSLNEDSPNWLAMHRAFDKMSGHSVNGGTIDTLFISADWLEPFESDIRTFYNLSCKRFFAHDNTQVSFDLIDFSKRLYKAEKRHTRKLPGKLPSHKLTVHQPS